MKYVLILLLFFEVLFGGLFFAPVFQTHQQDPDALSRSNLDMVYRDPSQVEAEDRRNRRRRILFKTAMAILFLGNGAAIVVAFRRIRT